jgi:hypothetical protein
MRTLMWSCLAAILLAGTAAPQDRPDFSGHWILVNPRDSASDIAQALTVRQSIVRTTARGTPMKSFLKDLTVERSFTTGLRSETYQIGIEGGVVGGIDRTGRGSSPTGESPQTRFAVRWAGNSLVIETGNYSGTTRESGPYTEHAEVWRFDARGRLVITATDRSSAAERTTRVLTYRRR